MTGVRVQVVGGRVRFPVRVQPRASRREIVGVYGDALKVRLTAPPVDGAANDELIEMLAETFAVGRRAIRILAGGSSRSKIVEIEGITEQVVNAVVARSGR
jgi:uncharacterized protein (TIGR00251 family)